MVLPKDNKYKFAKRLDNEDEYRKIADNLIEFAKKESSLDINEFPLNLMINPERFAEFSEHSDYFANAYDNALRIIGVRLKRLMQQGVIERQFALEILPLYDPEYRRYLKEKKSKDDTPPGKTKFIVIEMPGFCPPPNMPPRERKAEERSRSEILAEEIARRKKEILADPDFQ